MRGRGRQLVRAAEGLEHARCALACASVDSRRLVPWLVRARSFIAGSGMFKYDDLSVGCKELRTIAEAAQKGKVLQPGQTINDL